MRNHISLGIDTVAKVIRRFGVGGGRNDTVLRQCVAKLPGKRGGSHSAIRQPFAESFKCFFISGGRKYEQATEIA